IVHVPDVILVPLDEDVQVVSAGASTMQTVADTVTGTRGTRRHSALFAAGTHPQAVLEDGSKIPLAQLSVRITEYTVGENGPKRMPAPLPPTSQYTLAFEVSVDEAIQLRAESVELDKPVVHHVDNFLGFSTGTVVPVGYFDRGTGVWKAEKNGRVIEIIAIDD